MCPDRTGLPCRGHREEEARLSVAWPAITAEAATGGDDEALSGRQVAWWVTLEFEAERPLDYIEEILAFQRAPIRIDCVVGFPDPPRLEVCAVVDDTNVAVWCLPPLGRLVRAHLHRIIVVRTGAWINGLGQRAGMSPEEREYPAKRTYSVCGVTRFVVDCETLLRIAAVDDVDAVYERARTTGAEIIYPITDEEWGLRRFFVRDPNGAVINVTEHRD
jgi:hypothetical protein